MKPVIALISALVFATPAAAELRTIAFSIRVYNLFVLITLDFVFEPMLTR